MKRKKKTPSEKKNERGGQRKKCTATQSNTLPNTILQYFVVVIWL